ncbi:MAG: type II secretion system protein [Sulfuricurvum sp.]|jgi:general secretion pathway protein G
MKRLGVSMLELVFVIVIMGILAAVALPKLNATRDDAHIAKGRSDVSAIRAAIVNERQGRLMKGQSNYINKLHRITTTLFDNNGTTTSTLLQYGIVTKSNSNGHWQPSATLSGTNWVYKYRIKNVDNTFTYNPTDGTFKCTSGTYCSQLTN